MKENLYELIYLFFLMDEEVFFMLIEFFRPITVGIIYSLISQNITDDLRDEYLNFADEIFYECLLKCRIDQYKTLKGFYRTCLKNKLLDYLKGEKLKSPERFYRVVSLDEECKNLSSYYSSLALEQNLEIHEEVMVKIESEQILKIMNRKFSPDEITILALKRNGFTIQEISIILNIGQRKVTYVLNKIKKWFNNR